MTIAALAPARPTTVPIDRARALGWAAAAMSGLVLAAAAHRLGGGRALLPAGANPWLLLHLASVVPALPLGAALLLRRKGGRAHRLLGRLWAVLMMLAALSSFGLTGFTGRLSPLHLLSAAVLVGVPRAIRLAARGDVARHRRAILRVAAGLVAASAFAFVPGRLLSGWLFG